MMYSIGLKPLDSSQNSRRLHSHHVSGSLKTTDMDNTPGVRRGRTLGITLFNITKPDSLKIRGNETYATASVLKYVNQGFFFWLLHF